MTSNSGNKSKNTAFKRIDIFSEERINLLLAEYLAVLRLQLKVWSLRYRQAYLLGVQDMAVANRPQMRRAQVRLVFESFKAVHQPSPGV